MNWWNSAIDWLTSNEGQRVVDSAILPFLAIVIAGVLAALIARGMAKRLLDDRDQEAKASAVTSLVSASRRAIDWSDLSADERSHSTLLADEAGIRLRLLPVPGAGLAAAWVEHEIASIRSHSATFRFQAEQTFADVRDRLIEWQGKPRRAKRLFRDDVDRWQAEERDASATKRAQDPAVGGPTHVDAAPAHVISDPATPASGAVAAPASPVDAAQTAERQPEAEHDPSRAADPTDTGSVPVYDEPVSAHQVRRRTSPDLD